MTSNAITAASAAQANFDAISRRDLDALAAGFSEHAVVEWLPVGVFHGREEIRDFWAEVLGAVPDSQLELTELICEGDRTVALFRWRGTFSGGAYIGIHATGKPVDLRGCTVMRIADGLVVDETVYFDGLGWARQIGLLPRADSLADKALTAAFNAQTDFLTTIRTLRGKSLEAARA